MFRVASKTFTSSVIFSVLMPLNSRKAQTELLVGVLSTGALAYKVFGQNLLVWHPVLCSLLLLLAGGQGDTETKSVSRANRYTKSSSREERFMERDTQRIFRARCPGLFGRRYWRCWLWPGISECRARLVAYGTIGFGSRKSK